MRQWLHLDERADASENSRGDSVKVGDLVRVTSGTKHHGSLGVIVDTRPRFLDPLSEEMLMTVLYSDGNEGGWSEYNLEVINESR